MAAPVVAELQHSMTSQHRGEAAREDLDRDDVAAAAGWEAAMAAAAAVMVAGVEVAVEEVAKPVAGSVEQSAAIG